MWHERNKTEGEYKDTNKLANLRRDVLHRIQLTEGEINKIEEEVKAIKSKIKNNIEIKE